MENSQRAFEFLKAGNAGALRQLMEDDAAAAETRDPTGVSLLMQSLYHGHRDLADLIAGKKHSLDIFEAAALGRLDRLRACINDASTINSYSNDGFTALHFACFFGQPEAARLLLEAGATADGVAANPTKVMPLHSAASARNLEAARLLLERGAPANARQQGGWAPIHAAAQNGDRALVELLLKRHADPKLANDAGKTPAMVAREKGHNEIADLLEKQKS